MDVRRARKNWSKYLELLFRDAALTLRVMPGAGCKPAGYQSAQPKPVRDWWENYGQEAASKGRAVHALSRAAITRLDFALVLIGGAQLTEIQRHTVWKRAERKQWKQISYELDTPIRTLQREYFKALAELCAYAIARHKKGLADIRWRKSAGKVVDFRQAA